MFHGLLQSIIAAVAQHRFRVIAPLLSGLASLPLSAARDDLSHELFPLTGVVFQDNAPLSNVLLEFHRRDNHNSRFIGAATTDVAGHFQASTHNCASGLRSGTYDVTLRWQPLVVRGEGLLVGPNRWASDWADPSQTPLQVTVSEQLNSIVIDVHGDELKWWLTPSSSPENDRNKQLTQGEQRT